MTALHHHVGLRTHCNLQIVNRCPQFSFCNFHCCSLQVTATSSAQPNAAATPTPHCRRQRWHDTAEQRIVYEISRLRSFDDERLPAALITAGAIALVGDRLAILSPRRRRTRPRHALGRDAAAVSSLLAGLVVFFLGIERRTTREVVHNSQVAVLVDVSQSMGLSENENASETGDSRIKAVVDALGEQSADRRPAPNARCERRPLRSGSRTGRFIAEESRAQNREPRAGTCTMALLRLSTLDPRLSTQSTGQPNSQPRGTQTRLGQALADELRLYHDAPLAGVVVISDGAQNAGIEPGAAIEAARQAKVPLYHGRCRLRRLATKRRDPRSGRAHAGIPERHAQRHRLSAGQRLSRPIGRSRAHASPLAGSSRRRHAGRFAACDARPRRRNDARLLRHRTWRTRHIRVPTPREGAARRRQPPRQRPRSRDRNRRSQNDACCSSPADRCATTSSCAISCIRDPTMITDVCLQTAQPGISQDANENPRPFPEHARRALPVRLHRGVRPRLDEARCRPRVELVEKWVSEEAGGMIAVAGADRNAEMDSQHRACASSAICIPVVFQNRLTLMDDGQPGGDTPWPLAFERAGREARFLWIAKNAADSEVRLGQFSRRLRLLLREGRKARRHRLRPLLEPGNGRRQPAARLLWRASSTAPARCFTWAAAKCGGSGASIPRISKSSTRN